VEQSRLRVLEPTFFRKWGRGGRGPGASPGVPNLAPGPPRRLAAQGGKGELCAALALTYLAVSLLSMYYILYIYPPALGIALFRFRFVLKRVFYPRRVFICFVFSRLGANR
jgi:hypothetical protein